MNYFIYLRSMFEKSQLRVIYISFVQSIITYSIEIWKGETHDVDLNKVTLTMNEVILYYINLF